MTATAANSLHIPRLPSISERSGHLLGPPCQKCVQAGVECILATSNRGGYRPSKKRRVMEDEVSPESSHSQAILQVTDISRLNPSANLPPPNENVESVQGAHIDDAFATMDLHSTSDALNILSRIAGNAPSLHSTTYPDTSSFSTALHNDTVPADHGLRNYYLVSTGVLTTSRLVSLLEYYKRIYHPYYTLAPAETLDPACLPKTAQEEPHLLTAILTVVLKDMVDEGNIFESCAQYMQSLIAEIASEWEPQCGLAEGADLGYGQEDTAAWMHIGLAIRLAYALKLDKAALLAESSGMSNMSRERLVWAACYLSDRQISVRIGRPFVCRGLEPSILYGRRGFPLVRSESVQTNGFDQSIIFQARLQLTEIFTNVHDVLYCNAGSNTEMMLTGSYASYLDSFRGSISAWNNIWGSLTCSQNVKILLQLSYEYLRLYTNSFAFQAAALRSISPRTTDVGNESDQMRSYGGLPEARFMYESIDAAKMLLTIVSNYISSAQSLSQFPIRFPLYCVNAAAFLYKIWMLNVLSSPERISIRRLIRDVISSLRKGSSRNSDHCTRYAHFLEVLWERAEQRPTPNGVNSSFDASSSTPPLQGNPHYFQDAFSWLDLEAMGDILWCDPDPLGNTNVQSTDTVEDHIARGDISQVFGNEFSRIF
ncbi:hypothetical protein TCE0_047r18105 [Talaromyces pinophilus]|uniref:Xylanolytic transcriptional activator regulatory domain-containing protein n=1 Tax=Talaromyces pinophilus TaxID=128442 RepID=A0A0B8MZ63_TALPI|nr:hypothetical protein TCE0_047r18105 [Talaromyces pinophilus]